jgi:hypothetical protein
METLPTLLETGDLAHEGGCSPTWVRREVERGRVRPAAKTLRGGLLFHPDEKARWLAARRRRRRPVV